LKSLSLSPFFNVMVFATCWAIQIFFAKLGFNAGAAVLPFQVTMVLAASITLSIILVGSSGKKLLDLFQQQPRLFWTLFVANTFQAGIGNILNIIGISMTAAINAGFLVKMATVSTILFAWLFLGEKLSGLKVAVVFVMLFGAYLITTKGQSLLPHVGDLFILGACICWSFGTVLVRKALKTQSVSADAVTLQKPFAGLLFFSIVTTFAVFYPALFGNLGDTLRPYPFSLEMLPYALASGISLSLTWIFLFRTLELATASYMTLMSMATPIMVSVLATLFLDESLAWIQVVGAGLIIFSAGSIYISDMAYN